LPFFGKVFQCFTFEDKDKLSALANLLDDPFLKDFIHLLPEIVRDVYEILHNLVLCKKLEGLADLTNITKLFKIILSSQSLVTQLS
jgi:hypothetical protein